jgi:hypothetical protein
VFHIELLDLEPYFVQAMDTLLPAKMDEIDALCKKLKK